MRVLTALRIAPAVWGFPVIVFVGVRFVSLLTPPEAGPYPLILTAVGAWAVAYVAPAAAGCAAWEAGRHKRAEWFAAPHARSTLTWCVRALLPTVATCWLVLWAAVAYPFFAERELLPPDLRLVAVAMAMVLGHALAGWALGAVLPVVVAVPAALGGSFLWFILPAASGPTWLYHLTGTWGRNCCRLHEELAPTALWGPLVFTVGLAVTAVLLTNAAATRRTAAAQMATLAPGIVALVVSALLVGTLGPTGTQPRPASDLRCDSIGHVEVCVWPENERERERLAPTIVGVLDKWSEAGIATPAGLTEQREGSLPPDFLSFRITAASAPSDLISTLSASRLGSPPICPDRADGGPPHAGYEAYEQLMAYFAQSGGMPASELERRYPPEGLAIARRVALLGQDARAEWLAGNMAAWTSCDIPARPSPG